VHSTSESVAGVVVDYSGFCQGRGTYLTRVAVTYAASASNFTSGLYGNNPAVLGALVSAELLVFDHNKTCQTNMQPLRYR